MHARIRPREPSASLPLSLRGRVRAFRTGRQRRARKGAIVRQTDDR